MWKRVSLSALMTVALAGQAAAETLITPAEAALPAAALLAMRGVSRGPSVKLLSPADTASPFAFKVKFEAHGGATVDKGSVKVTYLKSPAVDLTERLKPFVTDDGIAMAAAEVPPGVHAVKVEVKDSDGRIGGGVIQLNVAK